jgi:hypothetical protein
LTIRSNSREVSSDSQEAKVEAFVCPLLPFICDTATNPVQIFIPFIAETLDEKMYRVVMDRKRWFGLVMAVDYKVGFHTTDKLADRIPFPAEAAAELAFQLGVADAHSIDKTNPMANFADDAH